MTEVEDEAYGDRSRRVTRHIRGGAGKTPRYSTNYNDKAKEQW